jgi:hypothetical protein
MKFPIMQGIRKLDEGDRRQYLFRGHPEIIFSLIGQ